MPNELTGYDLVHATVENRAAWLRACADAAGRTSDGELLYRLVAFESLDYGETWWLFPPS